MQYKRWLARNGTVSEFLDTKEIGSDLDLQIDIDAIESEDDEANQDLIDWLRDWETARTLEERTRIFEVVA